MYDKKRKNSRIKIIPTFIDGRLKEVPVLEFIHVVILENVKRYGHIQKPKSSTEEELRMAIEDLVEIGWINPESRVVTEHEKATS